VQNRLKPQLTVSEAKCDFFPSHKHIKERVRGGKIDKGGFSNTHPLVAASAA